LIFASMYYIMIDMVEKVMWDEAGVLPTWPGRT